MPPKREKGTLTLDPDLREKEGKEGNEKTTNLLKLNREKRKRTLIHPQMGLNQNPAQRQKGWGLVRKGPTCKNKHRRTILPKQTKTPPWPLAITESTWNKGDSRQRDRKN